MLKKNSSTVLMLETDDDDRLITQAYLADVKDASINLVFVNDQKQLVSFLETNFGKDDSPALIIIGQNRPGSALEVLQKIKSHDQYKIIPVVIVSGASYPTDVEECYRKGANSFIHKPGTGELTRQKIGTFLEYWLRTVELP